MQPLFKRFTMLSSVILWNIHVDDNSWGKFMNMFQLEDKNKLFPHIIKRLHNEWDMKNFSLTTVNLLEITSVNFWLNWVCRNFKGFLRKLSRPERGREKIKIFTFQFYGSVDSSRTLCCSRDLGRTFKKGK